MNKVFMLFVLMTTSLFSKELIEDTKFRKIGKEWRFKKAPEYDYIKKPKVKSGTFSVKTIQTSEAHLLSLSTPVKFEAKKKYTLSFEMKAEGEGKIIVQTRRPLDPKNKSRKLIVGLNKAPELSVEWKKHEYTFEVIEDLSKKDHVALGFFFGVFQGEVALKKVSLVEVKE